MAGNTVSGAGALAHYKGGVECLDSGEIVD